MALQSRIPEIVADLKTVTEAGVLAAGEVVVGSAKRRVPVQTGALRDAIHVEPHPLGVSVLAGDGDAWYGNLVEHGTTRVPPHPFLVPALKASRAEILAAVTAAIRKAT